MTARTTLQESIHPWRTKVPTYGDPHFAKTQTGLPKAIAVDHLVYGHFMTCVFSQGVRHWVFGTQADRDRFVNAYRPHGAVPCGNPYP